MLIPNRRWPGARLRRTAQKDRRPSPLLRQSFATVLVLVAALTPAGLAGAQTVLDPDPARQASMRGFVGIGVLGSLDRTNEANRTASWRPALAGHAGRFLNRYWSLRVEVEVPATMTTDLTDEIGNLVQRTRQITFAGLFGYERDMSTRIRLATLVGAVIARRTVRSDYTITLSRPPGAPPGAPEVVRFLNEWGELSGGLAVGFDASIAITRSLRLVPQARAFVVVADVSSGLILRPGLSARWVF